MRKFLGLLLGGLFLLGTQTFAQDKIVTGKVTADDGSALPGVNISIQGTTRGTSTNGDGEYQISASSTSTLVFSFIGFTSTEIAVGNQTIINVTLQSDVQQLNEAIVVGIAGTRDSKTVGHALQQIGSDKLTFSKETNLANSLAGKIAGVQIQGAPSSSFRSANIRIRGVNGLSIYANPLYIVDGTPIDNLDAVNMDNVETITVLKGASATAIYGQRAAEGVVVVTSKKSVKGRIQVDINSAITLDKVSNLPNYQNEYGGGYSQEFAKFEYNPAIHPAAWQAFEGQNLPDYSADESWGPKMDGTLYRPYYSWFPSNPAFGQLAPFNPNPDNVKNFFDTGRTYNNNVSISGGSDKANFRASVTNLSRNLIIPNTKQDRTYINLGGSYEISKKLTFSTNINVVNEDQTGRPLEGYGQGLTGSFNQWFQRQIDMDILRDYKNPDGSYNSWNINGPENTKPLYWDNPFTDVYENLFHSNSDRIFGDISLAYKVAPGITLTGWVRDNVVTSRYDFRIASGTLNQDGFFTGFNRNRERNYEFLGTYNKTFGEFSFDANLGANIRRNTSQVVNQSTNGGLSIPDFYNIAASKDRPNVNNSTFEREVRSIYGTASIGYKGFIYLDGSLRNDWSSTLPAANNSYLYPSVSGSFVFSEFLQGQNILSFGKLKAGWAQVGSDTGPYQIFNTYAVGNPYGSLPTQNLPDLLPNSVLKPTLSTSYDLGAEVKFLDNRIGLDFTVYSRRNTDQILPLSVSAASGYTQAMVNAGEITNKGIEIAATFVPVRANDFDWTVNFNLARARTEVVELADGLNNYVLPNFAVYSAGSNVSGSSVAFGPTVNAKVGEPFGMLVGRAFRRDENGNRLVGANGAFLFDDNVNLGSYLPDWSGGVINTLTYKGFTMNFSIDFQKGGKIYSVTQMFNAYSGLGEATVGDNDRGVAQRDPVADGGGIRADGVLADGTPNQNYVEAINYYKSLFRLHEAWLYDASYAKLRELSIGYQLPSALLKKAKIRSAYVALVGRNLWRISQPVQGIDPSEIEGVWSEGGQLPGTTTFGVNVKLGF
ncbi:SusC/RagA family TonB-linked outer membrane protein [Arundinibacter roseus]|uniref:SusC/RagA family TonB-linked outer membrane protein n=1 Tax=Arundinibacter roseus TaxID=2070510 RepID=A0A4R4KBC5_9BACT|nr:SusC/RagA family TonB-linked outer membrane protein [Arundinibacter roseus]TDB65174.1 SusC/RagA family TonB-linked outer membrane protein [Arundinibacter roseus]